MKEPSLEQLLEAELVDNRTCIGEVAIERVADGRIQLTHRHEDRAVEFSAEEALEIAKFDEAGKYRALRTAPSLRRDWKITVAGVGKAIEVMDAIYSGRLAAWQCWKAGVLVATPLRETLNRQSGMYRAAAKISDEQINELVANFCRSDGGCLRTIVWRRDESGEIASTKLPKTKFDPEFDQTNAGEKCLPLLCQEACNLLVAACRGVVKGSG